MKDLGVQPRQGRLECAQPNASQPCMLLGMNWNCAAWPQLANGVQPLARVRAPRDVVLVSRDTETRINTIPSQTLGL
jgi:hypothetical protein